MRNIASRMVAAIATVTFALLAAMPETGAAQQAPTIDDATLAPDTATIGDYLTMTIAVLHDDAFSIEGPGFGDNFGDFELLEIAEPQRESGSGASHTTLSYTFTTFKVGALELPPLAIDWRGPGGDGTLMTEPQPVRVDSVLVPNETELRPLKPQLDISADAPSPIWPTLFVAIFAALTVFGYVLVQRAIAQRPIEPQHEPTPLTPRESARNSLDRLAAEEPRRQPREFYAALSFTLRQYLSAQFGFPAYAMTRRELQRHTSRAGIDRWPARLTANLLEQCDAVQFAGFRPAPERVDADLTAAYEIIELTSADPAAIPAPSEQPST